MGTAMDVHDVMWKQNAMWKQGLKLECNLSILILFVGSYKSKIILALISNCTLLQIKRIFKKWKINTGCP